MIETQVSLRVDVVSNVCWKGELAQYVETFYVTL